MNIEEIFELLAKAGCNPEYIEVDKLSGFSREVKFTAAEQTYFVEWWHNQSYLHVGFRHGVYLPFKEVKPDCFWPSYNRGLRFSQGDYEFFVATKLLDWQQKQREGGKGE